MAQAVKWLLGVGCALAIAFAISGALTHAADVREYRDRIAAAERDTDNMARRHAAAHQQALTLEALDRATQQRLVATQDSLARLRAAFTKPGPLPLPSTGTVDVEIVRTREEQWLFALNQRDSALSLSMRSTALAVEAADSLRVLVAITDTMYQQERASRIHWQQLAEHAPVGDARAKLLGFIPLPDVSAGVQAGLAFTGKPYVGAGVQVGYTIHLGGRKRA